EATRRLSASQRPIILAGVEIHRLGLQEQLLALAEGAGIPITTTMLGKSVISETHPLFAGIYGSGIGREDVAEMIEQSDCVVVLGAFLTDIDLAIDTVRLNPTKCIYATSETLRISHHHFHDVLLADFLAGLVEAGSKSSKEPLPPHPRSEEPAFQLRPDDPITIRRLIARVNLALDESTVVIADVGDALFASMELVVHRQTEFLSPAYYASMGFAVPAALGTMVARPDLRPLVLVGDGAFQMTGMELSNIVRRNLSPIIIVLDNKGYGTERLLHPGDYEFNNIHPWHYHKLPEVLGGGTGYEVRTEGEFDRALRSAQADTSAMSLIQVHLDPSDRSTVLERLAQNLGRNV
ncbi:MAG: thiamine pyrophosphate-dependent enzyme, partial [Planctomycetota bacterium]